MPGRVIIGDPLIFGTLGREAAFGLPGLTAPGVPGCADEPVPVVPAGAGVDGVTPGAGEPPGWLGAVPIPLGDPAVWAWAAVATIAANPAASSVFATRMGFSFSPLDKVSLPTTGWQLLFPQEARPNAAISIREAACAMTASAEQRVVEGGSLDEAGADHSDIVYTYKASLMGGAWILRLAPEALHWSIGTLSGQVPYATIRRIRLSFRPVTMQSYRFLAEIWADKGPKISIASTSWKSLMEQERQDEAYSRFIRTLHERIAAAHGKPDLRAGALPFLYWPGVAIFVTLCIMGVSLAFRAMQLGEVAFGQPLDWGQIAAILALVAMFFWLLWQMGSFFKRNMPRRYTLDAVPADLLPKTPNPVS